MRIIGGRFKGRVLQGPASRAIRPTSDRLRETLFNILAHSYADPVPGARVIDLFAGTGALGLEALSRGAVHVIFVETGAEGRALIRENVEALGVAGSSRIFRRDATNLGEAAAEPFGLAFIDPPYGRDLAPRALTSLGEGGWLAAGALCIVEEHEAADIGAPGGFDEVDRRIAGTTQLRILRYGGGTTATKTA